MLDKAAGYGYKKVGFILDRGYFSRSNIKHLDTYGYSFIIMVKGMSSLVNSLILEKKGTFENKWAKHIDEFDVYGTTIKRRLYESDSKDRYFHLYHSSSREGNERALLAKELRHMKAYLKKHTNEAAQFGAGFQHYYRLHYNDEKVIKTKAAYDQAVSSLQKLLDKKDAKRKDDLWNAVMKSEKSYDEILQMITKSSTDQNE